MAHNWERIYRACDRESFGYDAKKSVRHCTNCHASQSRENGKWWPLSGRCLDDQA